MSDLKMGRNPFGEKAPKAKIEIPTVEKVAEREEPVKAEGPRIKKPKTPSVSEALSLLRDWKLERFSFMRFERAKRQMDFLAIALTHPKWKKTGTFRLVLPIGGKRVSLSVLSARVQRL